MPQATGVLTSREKVLDDIKIKEEWNIKEGKQKKMLPSHPI